jgi:adenosine kinase
MSIVVTGSLAYDYIMNFPGYFKDHILPDKAHILSVSFLVDSMNKMRGGVAGNIAYNLSLLGERPMIAGTVGTDFEEYRLWLESNNVDTSGIIPIDNEFTSSCFITTDHSDNQIVAFYAGAMTHSSKLSLKSLGLGANDLVLISPSDSDGMHQLALECQQLGIPYVFDPGKQTPRLEAEQIRAGLKGASYLVGNDYEFGMMAKKLETSEEELIASAPITVVTKGESGSSIYDNKQSTKIDIPVAKVKEILDPTGSGDAYLAGLVFGFVRELPLEVTGRIAALAATYNIEHRGCQEHRYTRADFAARYAETFGPSDPIQSLFGNG